MMNSLDPIVLILGITCLGSFVIWLLGMKVESMSDAFRSLKAALVAMGALCASPVFFYIAWHQIGAKARLQQEHLPVCAALGHAVGAQGGRAPYYIWRFEALDDTGNILAYYEAVGSTAGWKIERRKNGLVLNKSGARLAIWAEKQGNTDQIVIQKQTAPPKQP